MNRDSRIFISGHLGLVGSALVRQARADGYSHLLARSRAQLDLRDQQAVNRFFETERPEYVFLAAGRVGGIHANASQPADFIRDNLQIQTNVIDAAWRHGVRKLLNLGSSCIYPKLAPQPIKEDYLLSGSLEPTNEWYAIAKIAGLKMCQAYRKQYGFNAICLMPTNLYGPNDNFDLQTSHVLPALLRKIHTAHVNGSDRVVLWGSGQPRREFLFVDDLADAAFYLMHHYDGSEPVNVGCGSDVSIRELAETIADVVGYGGQFEYDTSKPDGTPRKLLDVARLNALGWSPRVQLKSGIAATYEWYRQNCVERSTAA